jgi:hypothetical protein
MLVHPFGISASCWLSDLKVNQARPEVSRSAVSNLMRMALRLQSSRPGVVGDSSRWPRPAE